MISHVVFGYLGDEDKITRTVEQPSALIKEVVRQMARLAIDMILHPQGMRGAHIVLTGKSEIHEVVRKSLYGWLNKKRIEVVIDVTATGPAVFGYCIPYRGQGTLTHTRLQKTLFISKWFVDRLHEAYSKDGDILGPNWSRHLFLGAHGYAHELIHLFRFFVSVYTIESMGGLSVIS